MKARLGVAVAAVFVMAETVEAQKPGRFGLGIAFSPTSFFASQVLPPRASFTFPINFSSLRLEPEIGFANATEEETDPFSGDDAELSFSIMTIGTGAYFLFRTGDGFRMYAGPRLGIIRQSESFKLTGQPEETFSRTDTYFGAALGGEHFFSSHLSVGAEARLTHMSLGKEKMKPEPPPGSDSNAKASGNATDGVVFLRFYF